MNFLKQIFQPIASHHSIMLNTKVMQSTIHETLDDTNFMEEVESFVQNEEQRDVVLSLMPALAEPLQHCPPELIQDVMMHPSWNLKMTKQNEMLKIHKMDETTTCCRVQTPLSTATMIKRFTLLFVLYFLASFFATTSLVFYISILYVFMGVNPTIVPNVSNWTLGIVGTLSMLIASVFIRLCVNSAIELYCQRGLRSTPCATLQINAIQDI